MDLDLERKKREKKRKKIVLGAIYYDRVTIELWKDSG